MSESYTIALLYDILEILTVVHKQNVIHRDIKSANLMRRLDGKIVLIDFGAVLVDTKVHLLVSVDIVLIDITIII